MVSVQQRDHAIQLHAVGIVESKRYRSPMPIPGQHLERWGLCAAAGNQNAAHQSCFEYPSHQFIGTELAWIHAASRGDPHECNGNAIARLRTLGPPARALLP